IVAMGQAPIADPVEQAVEAAATPSARRPVGALDQLAELRGPLIAAKRLVVAIDGANDQRVMLERGRSLGALRLVSRGGGHHILLPSICRRAGGGGGVRRPSWSRASGRWSCGRSWRWRRGRVRAFEHEGDRARRRR